MHCEKKDRVGYNVEIIVHEGLPLILPFFKIKIKRVVFYHFSILYAILCWYFDVLL